MGVWNVLKRFSTNPAPFQTTFCESSVYFEIIASAMQQHISFWTSLASGIIRYPKQSSSWALCEDVCFQNSTRRTDLHNSTRTLDFQNSSRICGSDFNFNLTCRIQPEVVTFRTQRELLSCRIQPELVVQTSTLTWLSDFNQKEWPSEAYQTAWLSEIKRNMWFRLQSYLVAQNSTRSRDLQNLTRILVFQNCIQNLWFRL